MKSYAKQISQMRSRLRDRAHQAAKEDFEEAMELDQKYLSKLLARIHKGYWPQVKTDDVDMPTVTPIMNRKKGSRRPVLTVGEKLTILHQAIVQKLPWKEIAKEHRVSKSNVNRLVRLSKKKPKFLEEIHAK